MAKITDSQPTKAGADLSIFYRDVAKVTAYLTSALHTGAPENAHRKTVLQAQRACKQLLLRIEEEHAKLQLELPNHTGDHDHATQGKAPDPRRFNQ